MKVTLFLPTLNEIDGMKVILPKIDLSCLDEVLIMDGGSTDGTVPFAEEYAKQHSARCRFQVLTQKTKGLTHAYEEAIAAASGDIMISFSPDGNSVPELIPPLIKKIKEGYDMVILSRYLPGAGSEDDDAVTAFGNWLFTTAINLLFGGHYTDSLVMFRAWKKSISPKTFGRFARAGYDPLLSIWCARKKMKVTEIPGPEPKRIGGLRKMSPLLNGLAILRLMFYHFFWRP